MSAGLNQVQDARRLAFVNPPWVDASMTKAGAAYFGGAGLEVVLAQSADLPNSQPDVQPGTIYEWTRAHVPTIADAVFIGGNGFRAIGAIEALEEDLGRPVLTGEPSDPLARRKTGWCERARLGLRPHLRHTAAALRAWPSAETQVSLRQWLDSSAGRSLTTRSSRPRARIRSPRLLNVTLRHRYYG